MSSCFRSIINRTRPPRFLPSPINSAANLTLDGVGEWATASWGVGHKNKIDLKCELHFPHSLGLRYTTFTYYTGFRVNSSEYKVMGLAPSGEPEYVPRILEHLIDLREDGSFRLNMKYFNYGQGVTMTKEIVLRMARYVRRETGEQNLCLAGGVALNCVAHGKVLLDQIFDKIWIQPAALFIWYHHLDNPRQADGARDSQRGSYLGPGIALYVDCGSRQGRATPERERI